MTTNSDNNKIISLSEYYDDDDSKKISDLIDKCDEIIDRAKHNMKSYEDLTPYINSHNSSDSIEAIYELNKPN